MGDNVRLGLIGAGWVVRNRHLPALSDVANVELRQIWSREPNNARGVADEFGIPRIARRWQEIAESGELDAVIVATPPVLHSRATVAALEAGKHVLCQARMARNLREAQEMVRAARTSDLVTALYPPRPGLKGDRVMRRLLQEDDFVGEIREVRVTGMALPEAQTGYHWRVDPQVVGVNAMTLGMWVEVLNRWVGPARRLVAVGATHHRQRMTLEGKWEEAVVPDSLAISAQLACAATASYHFSNCAAHGPGHSIEIYGSRGALVYQFFPDEIRGATSSDEQLEPIPIPVEEERLQTTDAEFIHAIREGGHVSPDFEEGLGYVEFCEAVALSLESGSVVSLPLPQPAMESWGCPLA